MVSDRQFCRVLEKLGNVEFTRLELVVALLRVRVEAGLRLGKAISWCLRLN
jgi:hypothetical protein